MKEPQPASKSIPPTAVKSARASTTPKRPGQRKYTLANIIARLGRVDEFVVQRFVADAVEEDLVAAGSRASTERIASDGTRILGSALDFLSGATSEQRAQLPAVTGQFLSACATAIECAVEKQRALDDQRASGAAQNTSASAALDRAMSTARGRREVLYTGAKIAAAGDADVIHRLDKAYGVAADAAALASTIEDLIPIAREVGHAALKRGVETNMTDAFLAETKAIAEAVRTAGEDAAAASELGAHTQSRVNWWDGVCLWFIRSLIESFDAGHKAASLIPKLKVVKLQSALGRGRRTKKPAKAKAPVPPVA